MAEHTKLSKGDLVVHKYYGIGKIENKTTRKIADKRKTFYTIKLLKKGGWRNRYHIKETYIRPIASKEEFNSALKLVQYPEDITEKDPRKIRKQYIKNMEDGTILARARIIRDLNQLKAKDNIDKWANKRLKKAKAQFISEWSLATNDDKEKLEKEFKKILKSSIENIKARKK